MRARRERKNKVIKKVYLRNHNMCFFHVFAQTTHVVTAPPGFACVVIPATRLHIPSFIEIRSGVLEPRGVKIWPFPLLWLVAFTTACTTVQAVTNPVRSFSRVCMQFSPTIRTNTIRSHSLYIRTHPMTFIADN